MLYTTPDGLPVPESSDPVAPLNETLEDISVGVQAALLRPGAVASLAARNAAIPSPVAGQSVFRTDMNWREMYLSTGVAAPGWFPVEGLLPRADIRRAAAQTKSGNSWELVNAAWGSAPYAMQGGFTFSAGVLTVPTDGLYQIDAAITYSAIPAGNNRGIQVTRNTTSTDVAYPTTSLKRETTGAATGGVGVSAAVALRKGDALRVQSLAAQSSNVGVTALDTWWTVTYLSPA